MRNKIASFVIFLLAISFWVVDVSAQEAGDGKKNRILKLQSYESNILGVTQDNNDVRFMDFKLSLKYPIIHDGVYSGKRSWHNLPFPYLAFTGRFGFYVGERDSSPVIGKKFNPKLFGRYWLGNDNDYLDIGYAHESNGQSVNTEGAYRLLRDYFSSKNENPDFANDYISRGWDYLDLTWKKFHRKEETNISTYVILKYFLKNGYLQGKPEEYNAWEGGDNGKPRKSVDGITLIANFSTDFTVGPFFGKKIALINTTGYKNVFKYNTGRLEYTFNFLNTPIMLWGSDGYNSDLIDYYKRVTSYGLALELKTFLDEF